MGMEDVNNEQLSTRPRLLFLVCGVALPVITSHLPFILLTAATNHRQGHLYTLYDRPAIT